jgi:hypothetical protein
MANDANDSRWGILPRPKWKTALQAKTWLIEQRRLLGWSHKDVAKAFFDCAVKSDLYIGPGGGERFDRATEKRVARFEREGQQIPDWMYWIPLAIQFAQLAWEERADWERDNIPENTNVRRDREEEEYHAKLFHLDDEEIALIELFRELSADQRNALLAMAQPTMLRWWIGSLERAAARNTTLVEVIENALP